MTTLDQQKLSVKTASALLLLAGVWLFFSPFVFQYTSVSPILNDVLLGLVVALLAASRIIEKNIMIAWPSWLHLGLGVWLMFAPLLLRYPLFSAAVANDLIAGIVVIMLGTWAALSTPTKKEKKKTAQASVPRATHPTAQGVNDLAL